jgi:hypothetical protein
MTETATPHTLEGLMKWAQRDEWRGKLADVLEQHLGPACKGAGVGVGDLADLIGSGWLTTLWGCAFEDLVSRTLDDGRNLADEYLKRRGWKETVSTRAYVTALRSSVVSLYEVSDIVVGAGFLARDLIGGGEPVRVEEKSATKGLAQWDRISTRVVSVGGKVQISGALLHFDPDASENLLAMIKREISSARTEVASRAKSLDRPMGDRSVTTDVAINAVLKTSASMFSNVWVRDALAKALNPMLPQMTKSEGDPLEFLTVHYPLVLGVSRASVRAALNAVVEFRQADENFWNWLESRPRQSVRKSKRAASQSFVTTMGDGATVLGGIELKASTLTLSINSEARAVRGRELVGRSLDGLVRAPLVERQTVEQMMVSRDRNVAIEAPLTLPPDEARAITHQTLTEHYRRTLDEPIPALGELTPRQATRTVKGREKVVAWLKTLENHTARQPAGTPMADYDFNWLWAELGLSERRR